MINQPR